MIYHAIEQGIRHGVDTFEILLHHLPELIRDKVGDGSRWGVKISYHLARSAQAPLGAIQACAKEWKEEKILLGSCEQLPLLPLKDYLHSPTAPSTLFFLEDGSWSEWAVLSPSQISSLPKQLPLQELPQHLPSTASLVWKGHTLSLASFSHLIESNFLLLDHEELDLVPATSARCIEKGTWIASSAQIDPWSDILPPVFIGRNCRIKKGARIGPYCVIENNCIIDESSTLSHTMVCQNSYVGEDLDLHHVLVDRHWLAHIKHQTCLSIKDDFILCELSSPSFQGFLFRSLRQVSAALLLILSAPLYLCLRLSCTLESREVVAVPTLTPSNHWRTFHLYSFKKRASWIPSILYKLPMLWGLLQGELNYVGLKPRTVEEIKEMPTDWRALFLKAKIGLLNPESVELETSHPSPDEQFITEVFYTAHMSPWHDIKLAWKGLTQWGRSKKISP